MDELQPADTGWTHDLDSPGEVADMVRRFYAAVAQDDILGPVFNDVARVDWATHVPKITMFWCRMLFHMDGYSGNPYERHREVHSQMPFTMEMFQRWLELFSETVDESWQGPNVDAAKEFAMRVARVHSKGLGVTS